MMKRIKILSSTLFVIGLSFLPLIYSEETSLVYSQEHLDLYQEVINILEEDHYIKKDFASMKQEAVALYIDRIDPNKEIFLYSETENFLKGLGVSVTNEVEDSLDLAFRIFNLFKTRYIGKHEFQINLLEKIELLDLKQNKKILKNRSESKWLRTNQQLKSLWRNLLINEVIKLHLSGNDLEETKNKLTKRLRNNFNYFKQTRNSDVFDIFINSVTSMYGPHTVYMSPKRSEDFDIDMSLSLEGIGALLSSDGMYTTIASLVPGGPAEDSKKLKPKDKIVGVGQENSKEITDVIGWRIDDVVDLIRGPKNTIVKLEIIPSTSLDESETKVVEITRNLVKLEDQAAEKKVLDIPRKDRNFKIGVIELPAFYMDFDSFKRREYDYKSSSKDVKELIKSLKKENIDGLILDLRNNGGGSLFEANSLAKIFLGAGTTVQVKTSAGNIHSLGKRRGFQLYNGPLVVLVNKFSASASEILAGAIQDYQRGLVIGTDTFGKGTVQKVENVKIGQIKYTESKFYRVSGGSTQNKGVSPDIYLPSPIDYEEIGESKLLRALNYDKVTKVRFKNFDRIGSSKEALIKRNKKRIMLSPIFKSLEKKKELMEEQEKDLWLQLDIETRGKKKNDLENRFLVLENNLREELGLETYLTYQDFLDREEDPEDLNVESEILLESAHILSDYIEQSYNPIIAALESSGL